MTARLSSIYGLRLLTRPDVQRTVLRLVVAIVLLWRCLQFIGLTGAIQWAYDFSFYWTAATHLLHGSPIYSATQLAGPYVPQGQDGFLYPPPLAALVAPLAALFADPRAANWVWAAIGAAILVAVVLGLARVERLGERYPLLAGRGRWWLVAAAFAFPPVIDELVVGNVNLLLLGLLTLAWIGIRGREDASSERARTDRLSGLAVGAATVVKVFPGLLAVWLLTRGRRAAFVWAVLGVVVLSVVALPVTGTGPWRDYPTVLANLSSTPDAVDALAPTTWLTPLLGFTVARVMVTAVALALLVAVRRADLRLGYAVGVVASVLATPAMYTSYLSIFVLPLLLGLAAGVRLRWLALSYVLMWGGQQPALGDAAWIVNKGLPTLGALVLLGALVRAALARPAPAPDPQPELDLDAEPDLDAESDLDPARAEAQRITRTA